MIAPDTDAAEAAMAALTGALARPFWIDDQVVQVGVTAGLATRRATRRAATN